MITKNLTYLHIADSISVDALSYVTNSFGIRQYPNPDPSINPQYVYPQLLRNYLRNYFGVKYITRAAAGNSTNVVVGASNFYVNHDADLVLIALGTNDAAQTLVQSNYTANMQFIINKIQARNPNAIIVICTPPNTSEPSRVANIASYWSAVDTLVANNVNCTACHLETAWDSSLNTTYLNNDSNGYYLHPNTAGHILLFETVKTTINRLLGIH